MGEESTSPQVAELIGWHRESFEDNDYGQGGRSYYLWEAWVDETGKQRMEPTVDDLLAWLRCETYFLAELMHHADEWHFKFLNTDSGLDGQWFRGSTLLAALESAVRAVALQAADGNP